MKVSELSLSMLCCYEMCLPVDLWYLVPRYSEQCCWKLDFDHIPFWCLGGRCFNDEVEGTSIESGLNKSLSLLGGIIISWMNHTFDKSGSDIISLSRHAFDKSGSDSIIQSKIKDTVNNKAMSNSLKDYLSIPQELLSNKDDKKNIMNEREFLQSCSVIEMNCKENNKQSKTFHLLHMICHKNLKGGNFHKNN